jgi:AcrR family transcriptional regulator
MLGHVNDVKTIPRRARAARTRRAILDASHAEFLERGYHGATIASIAARAGVAPQTVYFVFHTKASLVSAIIDDQVLGPDAQEDPEAAAWWAAMADAPTANAVLEGFVRGAAPILERAAPISEVVRAAANTDDEVRAIHEHHDALQRAGYRQVIELAAARGSLGRGLTIDTATDVLLTLCGDGVWVQLTVDRGWTADQVVDWQLTAVPAAILAEE